MKKLTDLSPFTNVIPYASEIFGVYQPLLGWKSRRVMDRIHKAFRRDVAHVQKLMQARFRGNFELALEEDRSLKTIGRLEPAKVDSAHRRTPGSFIVESISRELPSLDEYDDSVWDGAIDADRLNKTLESEVVPKTTEWYRAAHARDKRTTRGQDDELVAQLAEQLNLESSVAGYLLYLKSNKQTEALKELFYQPSKKPMAQLLKLAAAKSPLDVFDPLTDIARVGLSPIGIVHLFRQYFFEFDTFLGPPTGHVWVSPGATVELLEISTRKTTVERVLETGFESKLNSESQLTEQDELSDAVRQENQSNTKFGMSTTAEQSWVGGSATATGTIDLDSTQSTAREQAHRSMRQQTDKLSSEIRRNYKTTFKTVTEVTDTSSKRYVLGNPTDRLLNYELRRKMRQVGVQVQDVGTYLCWQTYVDDPGRELGVAKLVHIAKDPDLGSTPAPEAIPIPEAVQTERAIDIPFVPKTEDTIPADDMDEAYRNGKEVNLDYNEGSPERIEANFGPFEDLCDQPGYQFARLDFDYQGKDVEVSVRNFVEDPSGKIRFDIHLDHVNFHDVSPMRILAKTTWLPKGSVIEDINAKNQQKTDEFNEKTRYEFEKAYVNAARERIKLASDIRTRKFEDLREEERIVVYRRLIQDMLTKDIPMPDDRTRHVVAELLNTIFDVDKMLYFVAPEWWRPRMHRSHQGLGGIRTPSDVTSAPSAGSGEAKSSVFSKITAAAHKNVFDWVIQPKEDSQISPTDLVSWGGASEGRVDNYYITEESEPAKLGASLGWLLQLDGDNMRNAFLNAPWVKAVIPVRPGQERAAINWLSRVHVEGSDGLDAKYVAPPDQLADIPHSGPDVTIRDAINHLCDVVAQKHDKAMSVGRYPVDEINDDNRVSATPLDKVYEHGFYPLQGGFRVMPGTEDFEVFDQWVEVLPTDQVVPVEVSYDPKTGRQI